jgi:diguanylate cyclase (GGDEF)-like protein
MSSVASATTPAHEEPTRSPRRDKSFVTRRVALQLLAGLLVVAGIPVVATVRILDANALRNERARADAALQAQVQQAGQNLQGLSDNAAGRAEDVSRSPALQQAFLTRNRTVIAGLAHKNPGMVFYLRSERVAGTASQPALTRSVALVLNGVTVGRVVAQIPLGPGLAKRILKGIPHGRQDRLLVIHQRRALGSLVRVRPAGRTIDVGGKRYRGGMATIPNAPGTKLVALRPESAIAQAVAPYQQRVLFAALGSFALLVLVGLLFGGPILRGLGDFRRVVSQAATDSLTGLANRWSFDEELALEWRRAHRIGDSLSLVLLDLDDFKQVNDTYGHPAGDAVLRTIGELLLAGVRQIDLAARYGGEEFVILAPESDLKGALQLARRLRASIRKKSILLPDGKRVKVTASFGVATAGELASAEELIVAADEALYEAKRAGKDRVVAAGATIKVHESLGESGLRPARSNAAGSGGERRPPNRRSARPGAEDPA